MSNQKSVLAGHVHMLFQKEKNYFEPCKLFTDSTI